MRNIIYDFSNQPRFVYSGDMLAEEIMGIKGYLIEMNPLPTSTWQSQEASKHPEMQPLEMENVILTISIPEWKEDAQALIRPNLPWAEDHFNERIGGKPVNPPPSQAWWPYAQVENAEHKHGNEFSHTYPERMWPKHAGKTHSKIPNWGLRYLLGDLDDVIKLLVEDPLTRQAYLPIWFPEDTGSVVGQRVPCTLGYHFTLRPGGNDVDDLQLHVNYFMRSCDIMRHFVDDLYMAVRLAQHVRSQVEVRLGKMIYTGELMMFMSSLHLFKGDIPIVKAQRKLWTKTGGKGFTHAAAKSK